MTIEQIKLEAALKDALERQRHWHLREINLAQQVQLAIIECSKATEQVDVLQDQLLQLKRSEFPLSGFFRGFWK